MRWLIALVLFSCSLLAQQLNVTVTLRSPLPAAISAWAEDPTLVRIVISSATNTPAYPNAVVSFEVRDLGNQRVVARSRDGHPRQPRITIPAGPMTLMLTGRDIIAQEAVQIEPSIESQVAATGYLPEGTYQFCVRLLDQALQPIAATGQLCPTAPVVVPDPPVLLTPSDTSRLTTPLPLFSWTSVQPPIGGVSYRLRIVPVFPGQDRRAAIERNTPLYEQTLSGTTLAYPASAPSFSLYPDAQAFAWQVQALLSDGRPAARNEGKSAIFLFYPPTTTTARGGAPGAEEGGGPRVMGTPAEGGVDTILVTRIRVGGSFTARLHTPVRCRVGSNCTIGPDTAYIFIPWLGDTLVVPFGSITINVPSFGVPQLLSGTLAASIEKTRFLRHPAASVQHLLRLLEWEFTSAQARVRARVIVDWASLNFSCRTRDSVDLGWQNFGLTGLPPIRLKLPTAWECDGNGMLIGPCFSARFDSLLVEARFDTVPPRNFTGSLMLRGELTISCLDPPVTASFYLRADQGGVGLLLTLVSRIRSRILGTPIRIQLDTLVLDLAQDRNPAGFPPSGTCTPSDWGAASWRGLWLPSVRISVPFGDNDSVVFDARDVVAEDVGGQLKLSLSVQTKPTGTVRFAGFQIRVDTLRARWCRGAFSEFAFRGLLLLPPGLSKPAGWAQLDSLYVRFTCDASGNWTGSLDIYGFVDLTFGSYAKLQLQNGRLARLGPGSGYVEFSTIRLYAPADGSNFVVFNGLRIWNDGRVELESAEGWINVSRWANLSIAGIGIQVQEVGIGYHQPSGACSSSTKHWWVGLSGGVGISTESGLPGGGNGVRVRRLRIYRIGDDFCMTSEGAGVDITIQGVFSLRGDLQWGDITYSSSGSDTVRAKGIRGTLSGSFTCLGGFEAQVDFALGSVTSASYNFWFVQGAAVVPGGVPIVPGAFHLVGGILGAGWHVRLDDYNRDRISETSGIVPPPPIVPDPSINLLLRGGLIFADASLQFYRLTATGTIALGSSLQLGIDAGLTVIPALRLLEGTAGATVSISGGRLRPPIHLSGSVAVQLLRIDVFSAGFSADIQPGQPCFQVGPLQKNWILADLDANVGSDLLGAGVVAKAYASMQNLQLRLCPTQGFFQGSFSGAGVLGVTLEYLGIDQPFHFGLRFSSDFCGYYLFRFSRSGDTYTGRAKLAGVLDVSLNFDQSGWYSWGWKGTQAWDHVQGYYCGSGNWVDLGRHWDPCWSGSCSGSTEKCRQQSITLRARGIFQGQITIPQTCFTAAGRTICLPKLQNISISADYGYYGYGRWNDREGAKKGGPLADAAQSLSCGSLSSEQSSWAQDNAQQQEPPSLVVTSWPGRGQSGFAPTQPLRLVLGAPIDGRWTPGGSGLRQWQLRNVTVRLEDLGVTPLRTVRVDTSRRAPDTLVIYPRLQRGSSILTTLLLPNTRYRLIVEGDFYAQNPGGGPYRMRDTITFTTGALEGFPFHATWIPASQRFRNGSASFTPNGFVLWDADTSGSRVIPLKFGRDLWLRIRDGLGRTHEWRDGTTALIQNVVRGSALGMNSVELYWDTSFAQPIVRGELEEGYAYSFSANTLTFTILNAKKSGSSASRPDTADRLLDGLPVEIDRWVWTRLPAASEGELQLSTAIAYHMQIHRGEVIVYIIRLRNTGSQRIFAGTPFQIRIRKNLGSTVTESYSSWHLPHLLRPGEEIAVPLSVPAEPGLRGISIQMVPAAPFRESDRGDNCIDIGSAGCASCTPPVGCSVPVPGETE
jgi:hypothetical protein